MTGIYTPHSAVTSHPQWIRSTLGNGPKIISVDAALGYINYRRMTSIFPILQHDWRAFLATIEWDLITHHGVNPAQITPEPTVSPPQVV